MSARVIVALVLLAVGLLSGFRSSPQPTPAPPAPDQLNLRGKFISPSAAADAATLGALCLEFADIVEQDGMKDTPRLTTGVAFDDLRIAAREGRCRGESIGARQPHARHAIEEYLVAAVGTSGGTITPEGRARWVAAFREVGRACADAAK